MWALGGTGNGRRVGDGGRRNGRTAKPALPDAEKEGVEQNGGKTFPGVHELREGSLTENGEVQVDREQQFEALIRELRIQEP